MGTNATVGAWNLISAHKASPSFSDLGGHLELDAEAFITSRHNLDCTARISVGELSGIGGHGTELLTHSLDFDENVQQAQPIIIGPRTFIGTRCRVLGGTTIPAHSLIAAGSVVSGDFGQVSGVLLAGAPAIVKKEVSGNWFDRVAGPTRDVRHLESRRVTTSAMTPDESRRTEA